MRQWRSIAIALAVASLITVGMVGATSAGGAPSWNTNEPLQVPEDGTETVVLTVHDDISDESVDEVATITPTEGIEDHVEIEQEEIHFDDVDTSERVEIVVEPDLKEGERAEGALLLEHGHQTDDGISAVGVQYGFDIELEATEAEGGLLSGISLLVLVGAAAATIAGIYLVARRRNQTKSDSSDS